MAKAFLAIGLALVLLLGCREAPAAEPAPGANPRAAFPVVGYLPDWQLGKLKGERFALVDELIYFSIEPTPEGAIDAQRFTPEHRERLAEIRRTYGTRVRVAVGGWGRSDAFAPMATDPAGRARFVAALAQFCRDHEFAGADYDWEFPKGEREVEAYGDLLAGTKAAFVPHRLTLSVAVNRTQRLPKRGIDAVDAVHVMAYDDDGARHATREGAKRAIDAWLTQGVPPARLVLGLPFYGRKVDDSKLAMGYRDIVEQHRPGPEIDEAGGVYFNGPAMMERKTRGAREQGLGGVMIWEIGQDVEPTHPASLLQAIRRAERDAK